MDEDDIQRVRRDLHWLLEAEPLLRASPLQWRPSSAFSRTLVENIPTPTLLLLVQLRERTLGAYFEGLAKALFEASPDFTILAHNRIIQGTDRTLGELDLLLMDHCHDRILHLELALKFYLQLHPAEGSSADDRLWIGSGQRDFLAIKHERLLNHQLRLPELVLKRGIWPADLPTPDQSLGWVTGRLFYPNNTSMTPTPIVTAQADSGYWLTLSEFERQSFQGQWVNKNGWLAPFVQGVTPVLKHPLPGQFLGEPEPGGPWRHWFVVPDDWPASARDRMLHRFQVLPEETHDS